MIQVKIKKQIKIIIIFLGLNLWTKPDKIKEIIKPKEQIKQELIIDFVEIPFTVLRAEYNYWFILKNN